MCGIFGSINKNSLRDTYIGLKRLEYRGYDSFGYAAIKDGKVNVVRQLGPVDEAAFNGDYEQAIGHVRWATNGEVTEENAHPQAAGTYHVVHNGVVENAPAGMLDTKWIADLLEEQGVLPTWDTLEGDNAIVVLDSETEEIFCFAQGSKRLFITTNGYISSDLNALAGFDTRAWVIEDSFCSIRGVVEELGWDRRIVDVPAEYKSKLRPGHKMLMEIEEQVGLQSGQWPEIENDVDIIATGSSLHAAMFGSYALEKAKSIQVRCLHASQARCRSLGTNLLAISQSGETKDVINALKDKGDFTCITNNPYSTLYDMSHDPIRMDVGPEEAVAATKTFTASCMKLCQAAGVSMNGLKFYIQDILDRTDEIKEIADRIMGYDHFLFLGDRQNYPIALEGALKFKEVAYVHAEGMPASEMKHGPIALVDHRVPSLFVMTEGFAPETLSNIQEIKSRKGFVVVITHRAVENDLLWKGVDIVFSCKNTGEQYSQSLVLNIVLQLLSYYIAVARGINPDRPRNLAKCVTV